MSMMRPLHRDALPKISFQAANFDYRISIKPAKYAKQGKYFSHRRPSESSQSPSLSYDRNLSRLSILQAEKSQSTLPYCSELWSEQLLPRI